MLENGCEMFVREDGEKVSLLNREMFPCGMGTSWKISKEAWNKDCYTFTLFDFFNKGYRFYIDKKDIRKFGKYLNRCNEYMLIYGAPI